jgi:hypothetical protein
MLRKPDVSIKERRRNLNNLVSYWRALKRRFDFAQVVLLNEPRGNKESRGMCVSYSTINVPVMFA